jgi:hypothetical protein
MTFIHNNHLNKHGFFEVGEKKFYSKLDAILYSVKNNLPVHWNFNNEVFSQQDWLTEPSENIRELYRKRAQAIRDSYDYVVVMFSGGADSTTVLNSFFKNNIKVDEIVVNQWIKYQDNGAESYMNAEITHAAMPFLKEHAPKETFIRINDTSDHQLASIRDPEFRQRSYREVNNVHNVSMISIHYNIHRRFPEWETLYKQGKRLAIVWGEAKPIISYDVDAQKHYFEFQDHYAHAPQPRDQEANDPDCNHEQFFDDPAHPEIKIKQCHLLLNTLRQIKHRSDIFVTMDTSPQSGPRGFDIKSARASFVSTWYNEKKWALDRNALNCTIYPDWNFLTYHEDKSAGRVIHPAHAWMEQQAPAECKQWIMGYIKTYGALPELWTKHRGGLEQGIKRLQIRYYLE